MSSPCHSDADSSTPGPETLFLADSPPHSKFDYITDDTCTDESHQSFDGYALIALEHDSMAVQQQEHSTEIDITIIQTHFELKNYINSKLNFILSEFLDMLQTVAPHMTSHDATNIFHRIDHVNDGLISSEVLLHNEFLARILLEKDIKRDTPQYTNINPVQLQQETQRLQKWITECGQPAVEKVKELETRMKIYQNEESKNSDTDTENIQQHSDTDYKHCCSSTDNEPFMFNVYHYQKEANKYKQLLKEVTKLNEIYVKKNRELTARNHNLEEEAQDLREIILLFENDAMRTQQSTDTMEVDLEQSPFAVNKSTKILTNWYALKDNQRAYNADILCNISASRKQANTGDMFDDAVAHEIKVQIMKQIKQELKEEFQLKLNQKEIEMELKLCEATERMEHKQKELMRKYSDLSQEYAINAHLGAESFSFDDEKDGEESWRQQTKDRKSINLGSRDAESDHNIKQITITMKNVEQCVEKKFKRFRYTLHQIFISSTLMWAFPLIR